MERDLGFDDDGKPVLITRAAYSYDEQHRRCPEVPEADVLANSAFLAAAVAYGIWHNGSLSLAILAASIPLPWMAVLIANDRPPRRARRNPAATPTLPGRPRCFCTSLCRPRWKMPEPAISGHTHRR